MKQGGGDFSADAYEQLREAYSKENSDQRSVEERGHDIMGLNLGLETAPVDSPWADKIDKWEYPTGKSQYLDEHQDPAEILQIMRDAAQERLDTDDVEEEEEETLETDEEESEEIEEEEEDDEEDEEEDDDEDEDEEEDDDEDEDEEDDDDDEDEDDDLGPDEIADQIAELRAEIEQMQFVTDPEDDES
jgi:hypothetical protein